MSDHPNQIDKSPFAYAWNNPVKLTNPDGNCPVCPFLVWNAVRYVGTALLAGAVTYTVVKGYNDYKSSRSGVQDNTSTNDKYDKYNDSNRTVDYSKKEQNPDKK